MNGGEIPHFFEVNKMTTEYYETPLNAWPEIIHNFDEISQETVTINMGMNHNCFESLLEEIELDFPRVAGNLKLLVGHLEFEIAISKLIFDDRGDRQGFPKHIMTILLKLSNLHTRKYGHLQVTNDPWHDATMPA